MRIATWNVNSLKARLTRVEEWLAYAQPDILCLQETKLADAAFPALAFQTLGYESASHGDGRWNGVAILSRVGIEQVTTGFCQPMDADEPVDSIDPLESRLISATCGGIQVSSVYVPNGRSVDSEHYQFKLRWLAQLRDHLAASCDPDTPIAVCGDFNIAPENRDLYDPAKFVGATHVSQPERDGLRRLEDWGLIDAFRLVYDTWRPFRNLSLTAGLSYDRLKFPTDYRNAPIVSGEDSRDRLSPKAGVIWNPVGNLFVRGAYAQSLGGVSFDQSVGLEPNQVAGFNQVFRSIISESVVGSVAAPTYDTAGLLIEDKFASGTYVAVQGAVLQSDVDRTVGTFDAFLAPSFPPFPPSINPPIVPSSTRQKLRYEEQNLLVTVNQLVGNEWSFGARYQLSYSNLQTIFADIPGAVLPDLADHRQKATLHQGQLFALYNHRCGFFARIEGYWARQSNVGYFPDIPGDDIFQANAYVGYRFRRNYGDVTLGFLNMTDQDYKLNPLNYYNELPRERTLVARVRLNF